MCDSCHYVEHISYAQPQLLLQKRLKELVIVGDKLRGALARGHFKKKKSPTKDIKMQKKKNGTNFTMKCILV